ncbi:unnamed protein product [Dibothriocephalus latus]|uniref:Uncharacterized protein n=1 Tax=Dibothriocephalus latus TaxID=60516 RepID=A0A3P7MA48_DIBLA|nr:unnamed protein product [Dibothriocephalus latus]
MQERAEVRRSFVFDKTILLAEKTQILKGWGEHLQSIFNHLSNISDTASSCLFQVEVNDDSTSHPDHQETIKSMQQFSREKATGSDAIAAEIYKYFR